MAHTGKGERRAEIDRPGMGRGGEVKDWGVSFLVVLYDSTSLAGGDWIIAQTKTATDGVVP